MWNMKIKYPGVGTIILEGIHGVSHGLRIIRKNPSIIGIEGNTVVFISIDRKISGNSILVEGLKYRMELPYTLERVNSKGIG